MTFKSYNEACVPTNQINSSDSEEENGIGTHGVHVVSLRIYMRETFHIL